MNNLYDNGACLLGTKKAIKKHCKNLIKKYNNDDEDCVVETAKETLDEIEEFNDTDILCINYDCGMGLSIEYWETTDIIKEVI